MSQLNSSGKVKPETLSNVNMSMFDGSGWQFEDRWESGQVPFSMVTYSVPNGMGEILAEFSLGYIVVQYDEVFENYSNNPVSIEFKYTDGMTVTYDTIDDEISVLYYGLGIEFENLELVIGDFDTEAFFTGRLVSGSCKTLGNPFRAALALIDSVSTIVDVWEILQPYTAVTLDSVTTYPTTLALQRATYNGKLIQAIAATAGDGIISELGHRLLLQGILTFPPGKTNWWFRYKYNTYTHL